MDTPPNNLTYEIGGQHFSLRLKDTQVVIHSPKSVVGRMLINNPSRLTIIDKDSSDVIAEVAALLTAICGVQRDLEANAITRHHAIGVLGNILQLFDNSVPDPEPSVNSREVLPIGK